MTAEQFKDKFKSNIDLINKYGLAYYIISDVININKAEDLVVKYGFYVERQTDDYAKLFLWSKVFFQNKLVGYIDLQGFPSILFHKHKRNLVINSNIANDELVIEPIFGIHRVLDWHSIKDKMHCLSGGETILHLKPTQLTEEVINEYITKLGLQEIVEKVKLQNEK